MNFLPLGISNSSCSSEWRFGLLYASSSSSLVTKIRIIKKNTDMKIMVIQKVGMC